MPDFGPWTLDFGPWTTITHNDYHRGAMDCPAAKLDLQGGSIVIRDRRLGRGLAALLGTPLEADIVNTPVPASGSIEPAPHIDGAPADEVLDDLQPIDEGLDLTAASTAMLANQSTPASETSGLLQLPLSEIEENPFQPRREFSQAEIISLSESLKEHDLLQPILVRRV